MSDFEIKKYRRELKFILDSVPNSIIIRTGKKSNSIPEFLKGRIKQYDNPTYSSYCELLSASDAFILIQENSIRQISRWPNIIGDFLAAGRPIIIKPVGESANCVSKYPDAFILLNNDKRELSLEEEVVKKNNNANKRKIRRIAETEFSWEERAKQLSDFYANLFDSNCVK